VRLPNTLDVKPATIITTTTTIIIIIIIIIVIIIPPAAQREQLRGGRGEESTGTGLGYEQPWTRPPTWLYLPSLGILGNGLVVARSDERDGEQGREEGALAASVTAHNAADIDQIAGSSDAPGSREAAATDTAQTDAECPGRRGIEIRGQAILPGASGGHAAGGRGSSEARPRVEGAAPPNVAGDSNAAGDIVDVDGAATSRQRQIRGRVTAPGQADRAHPVATATSRPVEAHHRAAAIRGHNSVPGARRAAGVTGQRAQENHEGAAMSEAQRRLNVRNAHLAASLRSHAERVSKRDAAGDRPSTPTPADRLAALRRRVAGRYVAGGCGAVEEREARRDADHQATETAGDAEPETGLGHQVTQAVGTNDVLNIHLCCMSGGEFVTTACATASNGGMRSAGNDIAGEAVEAVADREHADYARAAAARQVAWHTAARPGTPAASAER
jgi:hypothetical protein